MGDFNIKSALHMDEQTLKTETLKIIEEKYESTTEAS